LQKGKSSNKQIKSKKMMNDKTASNKQEVLQAGNLLVARRSGDATVSRSNIRTVMNAAGGVVQVNNYYPSGVTMAELPRRSDQGVQPYKFGGKELDRSYGLDFYDFEARAYNPVLMRFTGFDPLASKYPGISPYAYCLNNPVKWIDMDGRDPTLPFSPWNTKKMEQIVQLGTIAQNNGSQAASASVSVSASAWKVGGKVELGTISAEGNVGVGNVSGKASTDKLSATITAADLSGKVSVDGTASVQANATIGKAEISTDGTNLKADASIGSVGANAQVSVNERNVKIDNNATVGVGVKISMVKAEISVKLDKAVTWFTATVAAIGAMITPETKIPDEVKRQY
jgi:RHS repeat-associated protein